MELEAPVGVHVEDVDSVVLHVLEVATTGLGLLEVVHCKLSVSILVIGVRTLTSAQLP